MPTKFVTQAKNQLGQGFQQQTQALQSQIPAINQLYAALGQQLDTQRLTGTQNILEGASGRGLLRSTIPVDAQTGLEQSIIQQRGELAGKQAGEISGVQQRIGEVGTQRASAIANLVNALRAQQLGRQQFKFEKQQSLRELELNKRLSNRQFQLDRRLVELGY